MPESETDPKADQRTDPVVEFILARLEEWETTVREDEDILQARYYETWRYRVAKYARTVPAWCVEWVEDSQYGDPTLAIDPDRVLALCATLREIVALHEKWPILVEIEVPRYHVETIDGSDPTRFAMSVSQQIQWLTAQEYRTRFGVTPPTAPMVAAIAKIWADHPDYPVGQAERTD